MNSVKLIAAAGAAVLSFSTAHAGPGTTLIASASSSAAGAPNLLVSWSLSSPGAINEIERLAVGTYTGIGVDHGGSLYAGAGISGINSIRKYTAPGGTMSTFTFGGALLAPRGIAFTMAGDALAANPFDVSRYDASGTLLGTVITAAAPQRFTDILIAPDGRAYASRHTFMSSPITGAIDIFDPVTGASFGSISLPAAPSGSGTVYTQDMTLAADGNIYFLHEVNSALYRVAPTAGAAAVLVTTFAGPNPDAIAAGPDGALYIAAGPDIRRYALDGADLGFFATLGAGRIEQLRFGDVVPAPASAAAFALLGALTAPRRRR